MYPFPIEAQSVQELELRANAQGAAIEAFADELHDTQSCVTGTTTMQYFQTTNPDRTLNNMQQGGMIQAFNYFEPFAVYCDILVPGVSHQDDSVPPADQTGQASLIEEFLKTQRATLIFQYNNKDYFTIPLTHVPSSGGAVGSLAVGAAALSQQLAQSGYAGQGGWWMGGTPIIAPVTNFRFTIQLAGPWANDVYDDFLVRLSLVGRRTRTTQ